jgi:hypothetical protein
MKKGLALLALTAGLSVGGCATVLNGTNIDYTTDTDPGGANVEFLNGLTCVSPCEFELPRGSDTRVDISKDGYEPTYVLVQSRLGGSTFGNIILGGGIGAAVDGVNGASNTLHPRPLIVKLAPLGSSEEALLLDKDGEVISTVQEHNDKVRLDVAKTIGAELAGLNEEQAAEVASDEGDESE